LNINLVLITTTLVSFLSTFFTVPIVKFFGVKFNLSDIPDKRVVGISKLARVVDCYAKRLQTQETMTAQIAGCIQRVLLPKGVAVVVDAAHQCMTTRGVHKSTTSTVTSRMLGLFRTDARTRMEFMNFIGKN